MIAAICNNKNTLRKEDQIWKSDSFYTRTRKANQFRPIMLTEETYELLQQIKEKTNIPMSSIAEMAIEFALNRVEIRKMEGQACCVMQRTGKETQHGRQDRQKRLAQVRQPVGVILAGACVRYGKLDYGRWAAETGMSEDTLRRRVASPEDLTLGELVRSRVCLRFRWTTYAAPSRCEDGACSEFVKYARSGSRPGAITQRVTARHCRRTLQQERRRYEAEAMSAHRAPACMRDVRNLFAAAGQQKQCASAVKLRTAALRPHKGAKPVRARRNETNQERIARLAREAREGLG